MIRVLIVDDQKLVCKIIENHLTAESDIEIIGYASNGQEAIEQIAIIHPDIALIDIEMPGIDGITTTQMICKRFPNTKVLVLSSHADESYLNRALQMGARGYLLKATPAAELASTIRSVYQGYFQLGPGLLDKVLPTTFPGRVAPTPPPPPETDTNYGEIFHELRERLDHLETINRALFERQQMLERALEKNIKLSESQEGFRAQTVRALSRISTLEKDIRNSHIFLAGFAIILGISILSVLLFVG